MKRRPSTQDLLTINAITGGWSYASGTPEWWTRMDLDVGVMRQRNSTAYTLAHKFDGSPTNGSEYETHDKLTVALQRAIEVSS